MWFRHAHLLYHRNWLYHIGPKPTNCSFSHLFPGGEHSTPPGWWFGSASDPRMGNGYNVVLMGTFTTVSDSEVSHPSTVALNLTEVMPRCRLKE